MALFITTKKGEKLYCTEVHVNSEMYQDIAIYTISVQADGHELEHIFNFMDNIPKVKDKRVVSWFGDDAKFIVANF